MIKLNYGDFLKKLLGKSDSQRTEQNSENASQKKHEKLDFGMENKAPADDWNNMVSFSKSAEPSTPDASNKSQENVVHSKGYSDFLKTLLSPSATTPAEPVISTTYSEPAVPDEHTDSTVAAEPTVTAEPTTSTVATEPTVATTAAEPTTSTVTTEPTVAITPSELEVTDTPKISEGDKGSKSWLKEKISSAVFGKNITAWSILKADEYDDQGRITKLINNSNVNGIVVGTPFQINYLEDGSFEVYSESIDKKWKFDADGKEIKDKPTIEKGSLDFINHLINENFSKDNIYGAEYDDEGRITYFRANSYEYSLTYNDNGSFDIKTCNLSYTSDKPSSIITYNEDLKKTSEIIFNFNAELISKVEYDGNGNIVSKMEPVKSGQIGSLDYFKNILGINGQVEANYLKGMIKYDEQGRVTSFSEYYSLTTDYVPGRTRTTGYNYSIKYNDDGSFEIEKKEMLKADSGQPNREPNIYLLKYDKDGNEIKDTEKPEVGSKEYIENLLNIKNFGNDVKFDEQGRIVSFCPPSYGGWPIIYTISYLDSGNIDVKMQYPNESYEYNTYDSTGKLIQNRQMPRDEFVVVTDFIYEGDKLVKENTKYKDGIVKEKSYLENNTQQTTCKDKNGNLIYKVVDKRCNGITWPRVNETMADEACLLAGNADSIYVKDGVTAVLNADGSIELPDKNGKISAWDKDGNEIVSAESPQKGSKGHISTLLGVKADEISDAIYFNGELTHFIYDGSSCDVTYKDNGDICITKKSCVDGKLIFMKIFDADGNEIKNT